jgi:PIN domain-containing protein
MSVPNTIFIDTSIVRGQGFNFESKAIRLFLSAAERRKLTLLLPDSTSREIRKHISACADAAIRALKEAYKQAPFLLKSDKWPTMPGFAASWDLFAIGMSEWNQFMRKFALIRLPAEDVNLREVMEWYDSQRSPFSPRKQKEFPDAFALSSILAFAKRKRVSIAVVSTDPDFAFASNRFPELVYFPSLPALTEALLSSDERVGRIKSALERDCTFLKAAVSKEFENLPFRPADEPDGEVEDVRVSNIKFDDVHVVAIGDKECTVSFEASVDFTAYVQFDDSSTAVVDSSEGIFMPLHRFCGTVTDKAAITGVAKMEVSDNWTAAEDITFLQVNETEIAVEEIPPREAVD